MQISERTNKERGRDSRVEVKRDQCGISLLILIRSHISVTVTVATVWPPFGAQSVRRRSDSRAIRDYTTLEVYFNWHTVVSLISDRRNSKVKRRMRKEEEVADAYIVLV